MAEFEMSLAEALVLKSHLSALGYPCKRDNELLGEALNVIVRERVATVRRFDEFKRNNPSEGPSKDKLPASPDVGGGPILNP